MELCFMCLAPLHWSAKIKSKDESKTQSLKKSLHGGMKLVNSFSNAYYMEIKIAKFCIDFMISNQYG